MGENRNYNIVCVSAEGLFVANEFVCKEFCLLDRESNFLYHTTIKSSKKIDEYSPTEQESILWKAKNFGLEYDCGDIELNEFIQQVFPMLKDKRVVVEHLFTAHWLKNLFEIYGDIDCVAVGKWFKYLPCMDDDLADSCHYHDSDAVAECALLNVLGLNKGISVVLPHLQDLQNTLCIGVEGYDLFDDGFVCKEICILSMDSTHMFHTTVKSPNGPLYEDYHSLITFETKFGNGLPFDCGEITLDELMEKIIPLIKGKKILVKDISHMFWLQKFFKDHGDLQFIYVGAPYCAMLFEPPECSYHKQSNFNTCKSKCKKYCAMWQAMVMQRNILQLHKIIKN